jgi:hypothetical protein
MEVKSDRSGISMLTNSKGLNPVYPKKGNKKRFTIRLTGIDDVNKYLTFIAHQRFPSSFLFFPFFSSHTLNHIASMDVLGIPPPGMRGWVSLLPRDGSVME